MAVCVAGLSNEGHVRIRTALVTADLRLVKGSFFVQTGLYHIVNSDQFFPLESICLAWIDCKAAWIWIAQSDPFTRGVLSVCTVSPFTRGVLSVCTVSWNG